MVKNKSHDIEKKWSKILWDLEGQELCGVYWKLPRIGPMESESTRGRLMGALIGVRE